ncbi:MAG TPA: hypothetical protein VIL09_04595 [Microvirga sp.]
MRDHVPQHPFGRGKVKTPVATAVTNSFRYVDKASLEKLGAGFGIHNASLTAKPGIGFLNSAPSMLARTLNPKSIKGSLYAVQMPFVIYSGPDIADNNPPECAGIV